jgi:hypothetical protein
VKPVDSSRDIDSHCAGSPVQGAVILFVMFVALSMYLAVVQALVPRDPDVRVPESWLTSPSTATGTNPRVDARYLPPSNALDQGSGRVDDPRECRPSAGIDSRCIYG